MTTPQPSASALNVARCRAIAAHDAREEIRGNDQLAEIFLDEAGRQSLVDPAVHLLILKKLESFSPGSYAYFIARTAYLDAVVEQALRAHIPQLVFLGAGYDTRACRFRECLEATRVFELDEPVTQSHKRARLQQAQVPEPKALTYVPIDFNTEKLLPKLQEAGYRTGQQTLFIWEGVTYYLPPQTVDETLQFVRSSSAPGSRICLDYMLPADHLEGRYGAQQARAAMQALYTAEPLRFDLDDAQVVPFLNERGFELVEHLTADQLQTRYLSLDDGTTAGPILGLFGMVQARLIGPAAG
ncbi:MAG: SAM-dependent methyltransferase [Anaerolineae bacterium]